MQTDESVSGVVSSVYFSYKQEVIEDDPSSLVNIINSILLCSYWTNISFMLIDLHTSNYAIVFLEPTLISIPALLTELAFGSLFRTEFFFTANPYALDLVSLGVCLLKRSNTYPNTCIL